MEVFFFQLLGFNRQACNACNCWKTVICKKNFVQYQTHNAKASMISHISLKCTYTCVQCHYQNQTYTCQPNASNEMEWTNYIVKYKDYTYKDHPNIN